MVAVRQDGIGGPQIEKLLQRHGGRLEHNGKYCGSCYGAEVTDDDCGNSCDEDREAYKKGGMNDVGEGDRKESSRFWGILNVLIRGISGDESGITHHRPHHAWERVHQNCLISTSLDYHQ